MGMRMYGLGGVLAALGSIFLACSSSNGNSGTGYVPNPLLCQSVCESGQAQGCFSQQTLGECQDDCEKARKMYSECLSEVDAFYTCSKTAFACEPGYPTVVIGCEQEKHNLSMCGACIPVGSDSPCDICAKRACCAEYKAFGASGDLQGFQDCIGNCSDTSCLDACEQKFPSVAQAFHTVDDCRKTQCPSACNGQPSTADPVGRLCARAAEAGCPIDNCEENFNYDDPFGCGIENYAAIECVVEKPVACVDGSPAWDEACSSEYMQCAGIGGAVPNEPVGGSGGGGPVYGGTGGTIGGSGGGIIGGAGGYDGG